MKINSRADVSSPLGVSLKLSFSSPDVPDSSLACSRRSTYVSCMLSVRPARSSMELKSSFGRFRCALGPNVSEKGWLSTAILAACCFRPGIWPGVSIKLIGSLLRFMRYVLGSAAWASTADRKLARASCEMTRVLLNHFRLGSTRATGASRLW